MEDRDSVKDGRDHEEARQAICCSCGRKVKPEKGRKPIRIIDERFSTLIVKFVHSDFSPTNPAHPTALCSTCRLALVEHEKVRSYIFIFKFYCA